MILTFSPGLFRAAPSTGSRALAEEEEEEETGLMGASALSASDAWGSAEVSSSASRKWGVPFACFEDEGADSPSIEEELDLKVEVTSDPVLFLPLPDCTYGSESPGTSSTSSSKMLPMASPSLAKSASSSSEM